MIINKNITSINRTVMNNRDIKYIVIHYVGAVSTAVNNAKYFKSVNRRASAHYFVDDNSICQCVEDKDAAWHCGGGLQGLFGHKYYKKCLNSNSIGVEMCCYKNSKGKLDISDKTIANTIELVKSLMKKYNISSNNVIRHYDVTGKKCPAPFVSDSKKWNNFKSKLTSTTSKTTQTSNKTSNTNKSKTTYIQNSRVKSWQIVMNKVYRCGLVQDGSYGPDSQKKANKHQLYYRLITIKNDYVLWLQNRLCELGYKVAKDRSFGPKMKRAVRQFQKDRGLKVDGYVGANTVKELLR